MGRKFNLFKLVSLLLLLIVITACSNTESNDNSEPSDAPDEANSEDSKQGGDLRIGALTNLQNLGVASELRAVDDFLMSAPALEKLGRFAPDGTMQPLLAESWEENPEEQTITFNLKEAITFHDGTDFNAEAVKWNLDEFRNSGRAELNNIEAVEVIDDHSVLVKLKEWDNNMIKAICNFVPIISPSSFEENGKDWAVANPVGTGPFKFVSWDDKESVKYEKFEDYWQEGKPYLDSIEFLLYADSTTAEASMQAGEIDAFFQGPALVANNLEALPDIEVLTNETGLGSQQKGIMFNSVDEDSPFYDPTVRQAVSYAIDRQTIIDTFLYGYGVASNQWGAPNAYSYNKDLDIGYDQEKAKELLSEAGYPDGFQTSFTLRNDPGEVEIGTAMAGYLEEIGIKADLNVIESGKWRSITHASGDQYEDLIYLTGRSDPDLAMYMYRNFSSDGVIYSHGINHQEEIDEIYPELRAATDGEKIKELSNELQRLVYDKYALAVPVYVSAMPVPIYDHVNDTGINAAHGSEWTPENTWLSSK